ncbi:MAG: hypothetical protein Q4G07_06740 [Oscillospiraceae bacterium]|nr:hypothetical protein [Oscillospiraceae bacterium]
MRKERMKNWCIDAKAVFKGLRPAAASGAKAQLPRSNSFYRAAVKNIFCALLLWYCLPVGLIACLIRAELYRQNRQKTAAAHPAASNGQKRLHIAA